MKKIVIVKILVLLILSVSILTIMTSMSEAAPILEEIYNIFEKQSKTWLEKMGQLLMWSFMALLTISFLWQLYQMALGDNLSLGSLLNLLVKVIIYGGFFKFIFSNITWNINDKQSITPLTIIPDTFVWLAEEVTDYKANIFDFLTTAENMSATLWDKISNASLGGYVVGAIAIGAMNIIFFMIVGQMIMAKIETVMITLTGFALLVFDGMMGMFDYWKIYLKALIGCGFKLFMLTIICGMINKQADAIPAMIVGEGNGMISSLATVLGVMFVLYLIARNVPAIAASVLGGSAPASNHGVLSTAAGLIGGAMAGVGAMNAAGKGLGTWRDGLIDKSMSGFTPLWQNNSTPKMSPVEYDDGSKG